MKRIIQNIFVTNEQELATIQEAARLNGISKAKYIRDIVYKKAKKDIKASLKKTEGLQ